MVMITMALRSRCRHQPMSAAATNIAAGPIPPRPARNGTPAKGPWGGVNGSSPMDLDGAEKTPIRKSEKFSLIPPRRPRNVTPVKDDDGIDADFVVSRTLMQ